MTLNDYRDKYSTYMMNICMLIHFLTNMRKDVETANLVNFINGVYTRDFVKCGLVEFVATIIYTIIDVVIEIVLVTLILINANDYYLVLLLSIIAFSWGFINVKLFFVGNYKFPSIKNCKNKRYHKIIENSKDFEEVVYNKIDQLNDFEMFLCEFKYFKLNVCSFGKYGKYLKMFGSYDMISLYNFVNTCGISINIYNKMIDDIYNVLNKKYETSKEMFNEDDIDELDKYIDKKFNSEFIENVYKNITPTDDNKINILFILLLIMCTYNVKLEIEDEESTYFYITMKCPRDQISYTIQMIEFKIFKYGFDKLKNMIMCIGDEEMLEAMNTF